MAASVVPRESPVTHEAAEFSLSSQYHNYNNNNNYSKSFLRMCDVCLRAFLFALSFVGIVVLAKSEQTETIPVALPNSPEPLFVRASAKFTYIPAMIYMMVALAVSCLYSIITTILSLSSLLKFNSDFAAVFLPHLVISDLVLFGIEAAASGATGSIAYTALKGNSHIGWGKLCPNFDRFCWRGGSSLTLCMFASVVLLLLVLISIIDMSKKIRRK